ncbi:hypothetical protein Patl1_29222 [Pistacia atlantica]|uniref:Uncharacterized protein n=1 Tax=Pistacia atlantica TaxID=434234 RepID=A0ACC1BER8_9ROSI|nr:hypothetical protein Patl1_29222 [Pistacia atlantica]
MDTGQDQRTTRYIYAPCMNPCSETQGPCNVEHKLGELMHYIRVGSAAASMDGLAAQTITVELIARANVALAIAGITPAPPSSSNQ